MRTFFIPNSLALVRGAQPERGRRLIDYLLSPDDVQRFLTKEFARP